MVSPHSGRTGSGNPSVLLALPFILWGKAFPMIPVGLPSSNNLEKTTSQLYPTASLLVDSRAIQVDELNHQRDSA